MIELYNSILAYGERFLQGATMDGAVILLSVSAAGYLLFSWIAGPFSSVKKNSWRLAYSRKWLKRFRKNKSRFSSKQRFSYIRYLDHFVWEDVLMNCFEERGYPVERTPATRDGGSDGFTQINGMSIVVQAKRYSGRVSRQHVVDLDLFIQKNKKVSRGVFIHTGLSSKPILEYVRNNKRLELISGGNKILAFLDGDDIELFGVMLNGIRKT